MKLIFYMGYLRRNLQHLRMLDLLERLIWKLDLHQIAMKVLIQFLK